MGWEKNMVSPKNMSIITELEHFLKELAAYQYLERRRIDGRQLNVDELKSFSVLRNLVLRKVGKFKPLIIELTGKSHIERFGRTYDIWSTGLSHQRITDIPDIALDYCVDAVTEAIGRLESDIKLGVRDKHGNVIGQPDRIRGEPPKAFIAHEGMTRALQKVKDFLDTLGIDYLIAEIEPSNGRVVEEQVEWTKGQADFAIILATKGKIIHKETGKPQMGLNVADELGRAREVFKNRIILLLQTGVEPHTNVSGIVYESFTTQYMENVFKKIIKELRNWGFLITGKG